MPTNRKFVFANDEIYHVFNRGVEKRSIFTNRREYNRAILALDYYRYDELPLKLSKFLVAPEILKEQLLENFKKDYEKLVETICFCLMPNHFHLLLKQKIKNGISTFVSNFTNSYTRYFNTRHERIGPLFEGIFKAVRITSDEQLVHISRYIHLNPVSSYLIEPAELENYEWSSYSEYVGLSDRNFITKELVLNLFSSHGDYKKFVLDQVDYARQLESIKHLSLEDQ